MENHFKFMLILFSFVFGLAFLHFSAIAQLSDKDILSDLLKVQNFSISYNQHSASLRPEYSEIKSVRKKKYYDQIDKIKNGPNREYYLSFLNNAIDKDSSKYKNELGYLYTYPRQSYDKNAVPTLLEYFKVVRYSLFTLNKDELLLPKDVPFLRKEIKY